MSEGVLRKAVKRRFLWRLGRERSCSEEGIGSPGQVTTLVFIRGGRRSKEILLLPSGYRRRNGFRRAESCVSAKAFASRNRSRTARHWIGFPIQRSPIDLLSTASRGGRWKMAM